MKGFFLFRQDLRLNDHSLLLRACQECDHLDLAVLIPKDFESWGIWRQKFWGQSVRSLQNQLQQRGTSLSIISKLPNLEIYDRRYCATIYAHDEARQIDSSWIQEVVDQLQADYDLKPKTKHFTAFKHQVVENLYQREAPTKQVIEKMPPRLTEACQEQLVIDEQTPLDPRSSHPFDGGELAGLEHLKKYFFEKKLASSYKDSRNEMFGLDYSTKFSAYLALGCLSPLAIERELKKYEAEIEKNDSTYWIYFELLWREFFRVMYQKYTLAFFRPEGISGKKPQCSNDAQALLQWQKGETGVEIVDAGMKELVATGYLSNRARQIVASFFVNELNLDWTLGAAFFEKHLIDYDVYSNWGNWMYLAGVGFDPRGKRWFDPDKQASFYDPQGQFRELWLSSSL